MRQILRKVLTPRQRQKLRTFGTQLGATTARMTGKLINILPAAFKVFLKSNLNIVERMDYDKEDIFLNISSGMERRVRLNSCRKEPETVVWIEEFFKEKDVFFDVGANVGAYSLVAAKYLKGQITVYAFEPSFLNFSQLIKNIFINQCQDAITPLNIALSNKTGMDNFNYQNLIAGGALHALGEAVDYKNESFTPVLKQSVPSYTVDDFIEEFKIHLPNHIKLDVDGIERAILEGAEKTISNPCLKSILVELGENDRDIIDLLEKRGFHVHSRHRQGPDVLKMYNYLFLRG